MAELVTCRCGWDGTGDHPCHWGNYTCRKPGKEFLYVPHMRFSLAGVQIKFSVEKTVACDEHRELFSKLLEEARAKEAQNARVPRRTVR
jgi:hypothetical protein